MSNRGIEDNSTMKAFFSGKIKIDDIGPRSKLVEIGHGVGIGHQDGSYSQYMEQLSKRSKEGNGIIYLGKEISEDKSTMSIVNATEEFEVGNTPKLLVMFYNIINSMTIKVEWKNMNDDLILEQYYQIPLPYSMNYHWWDTYSSYFIGPEDLDEGDYKVKITSTEGPKSKYEQPKELSSTVKFSVK